MFTRSKHIAPRPTAIALLAAILSAAVAQPVSAQISTVVDPVGDTYLKNAPAFQDVVFGRMTKTASGDFQLLMVMAGPVPVNPPLPHPAHSEIWWGWGFDLDSATFPRGYPAPAGGVAGSYGLPAEFVVYVSWDGTEFAGTAFDRRPLLTGGEAIITPVPFSIHGTIVEADLAFELIGDVPPSFHWDPFIWDWAGPVGSGGYVGVDFAGAIFDPSQPESVQISTVMDPVGDTFFQNAPAFQDVVRGRMTKTATGDFRLLMEMAGPVPVAPPLPPQGRSGIWWMWAFDLDPTAFPQGAPFGLGGAAVGRRPEFIVYVSWDGTAFAGAAIDRRPLLTGGEAIITPVQFSINGAIVEAVLASELIGDVPPSFHWAPVTVDWSGPVGSEGVTLVDVAETIFNP